MSPTTTLLEDRFRFVLRVLPDYYRQEREEEMVDTFLSDREPIDEEASFGRPGVREVAGVLALAVRSRLAAPGAPGRYAAYGRTARLATLLGVVALASVVLFNVLSDVAVLLAGSAADRRIVLDMMTERAAGSGFSLWAVALYVLPLGWIGACLALPAGRWRTAAAFSAVATAPVLVELARQAADGFMPTGAPLVSTGFQCLVALTTVGAFHSGAPGAELSKRVDEWLPPACFAVVLASLLAGRPVLAFEDWAYGWAFLVAGTLWLVLRARSLKRASALRASGPRTPAERTGAEDRLSDPALPAALAAVGLPILAARTCTVEFLAHASGMPAVAFPVHAGQVIAIAALEAVLLVHAVRALRREPRTRPMSATREGTAIPGR
ncbi:hypothetical protein [Streptomyces sp. H27-D2]|uniref:hypothetical protein n=1 Tax=Streptomyces sp. H27-D2 TaxID=3046304 RepID=UPI002DBD5277|nr:hypothetical protein [Streptomyces sp. H27-D2]MEC4018643.1 hypothetical protein [Streptomyces sp. H27-D2]